MASAKEYYAADMKRYGGQKSDTARLQYYFRKAHFARGKLSGAYYRFRFGRLKRRRGIELPASCDVGPGLYLGHAYGITVNHSARIGANCNIHKGVTIGRENRGDRVYFGINSVVVGNITVGDDVLIAPGALVNRDVPSHSIVVGNPGVIHPRDNATEGYVNNLV